MLYHDISYAKQIGYRLERFKVKNDISFTANFACPICGDSANKKKTRGYFFTKRDGVVFHCHNCQASMPFGKFLQQFDYNLYQQYVLDKFGSKQDNRKAPTLPDMKVDVSKYEQTSDILSQIPTIDDLPAGHPARVYVANRKIPEAFWSVLRYAPKYIHWASKHCDKFNVDKGTKDHPRLIIPWFSAPNHLTAYSARSFGEPDPRYYTIPIEEEKGFFGLDRLDFNKRIFVIEGAIDALFLPNSIAVGTSALWKFEADGNDVVYIPDRDVRNKEVMKVVSKMIEQNKQVCMLPDNLPGKDLNDFVMNGLTQDEIVDIINSNTYKGLEAKLQFMNWCKT